MANKAKSVKKAKVAHRGSHGGRRSGESVGGYKILGYTSDGVRILKPKGKPNSFTFKELEAAVTAAVASKTR